MKFLCRLLGYHKWKKEGHYKECDYQYPRYICQRCNQTAGGVTIGGETYEAGPITIEIVQREIKVQTIEKAQ